MLSFRDFWQSKIAAVAMFMMGLLSLGLSLYAGSLKLVFWTCVFCSFWFWLGLRVFNRRLVFNPGEVAVHNVFRTIVISATDVRSFEFARDSMHLGQLCIRTRGNVTVWCPIFLTPMQYDPVNTTALDARKAEMFRKLDAALQQSISGFPA